MGFLLAYSEVLGRHSVIAESALPHLPAWTAVNPSDVRPNPWDFEEPEPTDEALPADAPEPAAQHPKAAEQPTKPTRNRATGDKPADHTEE